jgi:hypothetical protein
VPWIQALIWAFKPTDIVDIRNLPEAERRETQAMIARLKGKVREPVAALEVKRTSRLAAVDGTGGWNLAERDTAIDNDNALKHSFPTGRRTVKRPCANLRGRRRHHTACHMS